MLLLANIIFQKKSAQEVTEAREVAIPQSLSLAIWSASLFWEIDDMTYYCPVIIENITHMYKKYVQFFQDINRYAQTHFQWRSQCTWLLVLGRQQFLQRRWWNTRVSRLVEEPVTELLSTRNFHCVAHLGVALNIKVFQHVQKTCPIFLFKPIVMHDSWQALLTTQVLWTDQTGFSLISACSGKYHRPGARLIIRHVLVYRKSKNKDISH